MLFYDSQQSALLFIFVSVFFLRISFQFFYIFLNHSIFLRKKPIRDGRKRFNLIFFYLHLYQYSTIKQMH